MKTIAIIFPNKLINFSDTMPFLYPMIMSNTITIHKCDEQSPDFDPYKKTARDVALDIKRSACNAWQIVFFFQMEKLSSSDYSLQASLYSQLERIKLNFMPHLSELNVREPDYLFVITLDSLERDPYFGFPIDAYQKILWEIDTLGYTKSTMKEALTDIDNTIVNLKKRLVKEDNFLIGKKQELQKMKLDYKQLYSKYLLQKKDTKISNQELNTLRSNLLNIKKKSNGLLIEIKAIKEKIDLMSKSLEKTKKDQHRVNQLKKAQSFKKNIDQETKQKIIEYFVSQAEINEVALKWDVNKYDIQVGLQSVNTDAGIGDLQNDTNGGEAVATMIIDCCSTVEAEFKRIIKNKKTIHENQKKLNESMPFRSLNFDTIEKNFKDALSRIKNDHIIKFLDDDPIRHLLYKHLRENFSVVSETFEKFTCIRFTMHHSKGDEEYRENMLQLTYLLIFLTDNGHLVYQNPKSLVPGYQLGVSNFLHAKNICIDPEELNSILLKYYQRLISTRKKLFVAMQADVIGDIFLIENPCECPGSDELAHNIDRANPKQNQTNLTNTIQFIEKNLLQEASKSLNHCAFEMTQWIALKKFNDKLKNKLIELNNDRDSCHNKLIKSSLINIEKKCLNEINDLKILNNRINHLDKVQSRGWPLFLCICISFFIFTLPQYFDKQLSDSLDTYWFKGPTVYISVVFLCILVMIKWNEFKEISFQKTLAYEKIENIEKLIRNTFHENVNYINKVCSFNAANVNIQYVKAAINSQKLSRQMIHYHEKQINDHIAFTSFLLKDTSPSQQDDISYTYDNQDIDFSRSVQQNPLYYPSDINQNHWTYQLKIGIARKREVTIQSRYLPALYEITITYDLLYLEQS